MNIAQLEYYFKTYHCIGHTLNLQANHGVGKSEVVRVNLRRAVAEKHGCKVEEVLVIDKRAAQLDPADLSGGIFEVGGRTYNAPPSWLPVHPDFIAEITKPLALNGKKFTDFIDEKYKYIILFLDEINRAQTYVKQALFELKLDRSLHGVKLPDNCYVIAAENGDQNLYDVSEAEPADKDREVLINFLPSVEEWFAYMDEMVLAKKTHNAVRMFITKHEEMLDPSDKDIEAAMNDNTTTFSRRSWFRSGQVLVQAETTSGQDIHSLAKSDSGFEMLQGALAGHIGEAVAAQFANFIREEYKTLSPKEILNGWNKEMKARVTEMADIDSPTNNIPAVSGLADAVVEECVKVSGLLNTKQQKNILAFLECTGPEIISGFYQEWNKKDTAQATDWYTTPRRRLLVTKASSAIEVFEETLRKFKEAGGDPTSDKRS